MTFQDVQTRRDPREEGCSITAAGITPRKTLPTEQVMGIISVINKQEDSGNCIQYMTIVD